VVESFSAGKVLSDPLVFPVNAIWTSVGAGWIRFVAAPVGSPGDLLLH